MKGFARLGGARLVVAVALALVLGLAACSGPAGRKVPEPTATQNPHALNSVLNVHLSGKPAAFNPFAPAAGANQIVHSLIYDSLIGPYGDPDSSGVHLTWGWQTFSGARKFGFYLRKGATWSDGKPLTSDDVLWSYTMYANPKSGSAYSANFAGVKGIEDFQSGKADSVAGFSTPDKDTFVITTDQPHVGLPSLVGGLYVMPKHVLGGTAPEDLAKSPFWSDPNVGMGPYRFVTYKPGQSVELAANPHYYKRPGIDWIFLKPVTSDVATAALGSGELDLMQVSPTDLPAVRKMKNVEMVTKPDPGFVRIAFDLRQKRFQDPRVRQAFLYAVDRKSLVDKVLAGKGRVQNSVFMGAALPKDIDTYPYDPRKARQLLRAAGWDFSRPVTLEWVPGRRDLDSAATVVESHLNAVGVRLKLKRVRTPDVPPKDGLLFGGGNYLNDPFSDRTILSCKTWVPNGANLPRYCNQRVDDLFTRAEATVAEPAQMKLYQQAARIENADVPYMWLYNPDTIWAYSKRLQGFKGSGDPAEVFLGVENWSLVG